MAQEAYRKLCPQGTCCAIQGLVLFALLGTSADPWQLECCIQSVGSGATGSELRRLNPRAMHHSAGSPGGVLDGVVHPQRRILQGDGRQVGAQLPWIVPELLHRAAALSTMLSPAGQGTCASRQLQGLLRAAHVHEQRYEHVGALRHASAECRDMHWATGRGGKRTCMLVAEPSCTANCASGW